MINKIKQFFCFHDWLGYAKFFHPKKHVEFTICLVVCSKCYKINTNRIICEYNNNLNNKGDF